MDQQDSEIILIGDINCHLMDNNDVYDNSASKLKDVYSTFGLQLCPTRPDERYQSKSSLRDQLATSQPTNIAVARVHTI